MTIDGYTVHPLSFPGGNIGKLAVCGTVNDLACRGAKPLYIALGVLAEEGFDEREFLGYLTDASTVCHRLGIRIVTGDTKVLPRGELDRLVLTTCGLGKTLPGRDLGISNLRPGDDLVLTGPVGLHGATIAALRYGLKSEGLASDCAPLWELVKKILPFPGLRAIRDCTRGGLATVLCEWAEGSRLGIEVDESSILVPDTVSSVCDLLGFDPFSLACEGCLIIGVAPGETEALLENLASSEEGRFASRIGSIIPAHPGWVSLLTRSGGRRVLDMPAGEILPRIC
jgi:hydrogenase expression/formation protein HypE